MRSYFTHLRLFFLLIFLLGYSWAQSADFPAPDTAPQANIPTKPDTKAKKVLPPEVYDPAYQAQNNAPRLPEGWTLLQKQNTSTTLLVHGTWSELHQPGGLGPDDFVPVNPPKFQAMVGLATVQTINKAGWCVAAGPRFMIKTTDARAKYATRSYASWASVGWGAGVTADTPPSTRMFFEGEMSEYTDLGTLLDKMAQNAPDTGVWVVSGRALFPSATGQSLRRAPVGEAMNDQQDPDVPLRSHFMPVRQVGRSGLITAIVIDPINPDIPQAIRDFLPDELHITPAGRRYLAHYALFRDPAPAFNPGQPFQETWNPEYLWKQSDPTQKARVPGIETVRKLLPERTTISRAHLNTWAIRTAQDWPRPEKPDLVDPTTLDSSFLVDNQWTRDNPLFEAPLFKTGRILLRRSAAEALVRVNKRLYEQGYRLKLYEGYRPFWITQMLWSRHRAASYLAAPSVGSRHNRASAVDCTLVTLDGRDVRMPSPSLAFDVSSHRDYKNMDPEVRENVLILTNAMQAEGWGILYSEWWHFDAPGWQQYDVLNIPLWPDREHQRIEDSARQSMLLPPTLDEVEGSGEANIYQTPNVPEFPITNDEPTTTELAQATTTQTQTIKPLTPALPPSLTNKTTPTTPTRQNKTSTKTVTITMPPTPTRTPGAERQTPPSTGKPNTIRLLIYLGLGLVAAGAVLLVFTRKK